MQMLLSLLRPADNAEASSTFSLHIMKVYLRYNLVHIQFA